MYWKLSEGKGQKKGKINVVAMMTNEEHVIMMILRD
jgi:hypothetical protein